MLGGYTPFICPRKTEEGKGKTVEEDMNDVGIPSWCLPERLVVGNCRYRATIPCRRAAFAGDGV